MSAIQFISQQNGSAQLIPVSSQSPRFARIFSRSVILVGVLVMSLAGVGYADDKFPGVQHLMTTEEFEAAGLDRLSADEIQRLNHWLIRYTANEAEIIQQTSVAVQEATKAGFTDVIERVSADPGGRLQFYLQNGQVWRSRYSERLSASFENSEVQIGRNRMGFYDLKLAGSGRVIGVKRIK